MQFSYEKVNDLIQELKSKGISYKYDNRDTHKPGWKFAEYELKGVPIRLSIGKRDIDNDTIELARRDTLEKKIYGQLSDSFFFIGSFINGYLSTYIISSHFNKLGRGK